MANRREWEASRGNGGRKREYRNRGGSTVSGWRVLLYVILPWLLLLANLFYLFKLREQVGSMNETINQALSRLLLLEEEKEIENTTYQSAPEKEAAVDYVARCGLTAVDKPQERTYSEILERLAKLGEECDVIEQIAGNPGRYPEQLLEALANNPEMADFAANYPDKVGTVTGEGLTESEKAEEFPLFLQWDPRWGYASYGDSSVVGLSGCGPTALSMVLYYLTGDESLTPDQIAAYSMDNGYYISGTGTAWLLMEDVPRQYGVSVRQPEISEYTMRQLLDRGDMIICSMGPGDFTIGGHFVVIYGYTEEGFLLNDPNCVARSNQTWSFSRLKPQIKNMWSFSLAGTSVEQPSVYFVEHEKIS